MTKHGEGIFCGYFVEIYLCWISPPKAKGMGINIKKYLVVNNTPSRYWYFGNIFVGFIVYYIVMFGY